jgi:hypothetical protein
LCALPVDWSSECLDIPDSESYSRYYNPSHNCTLMECLFIGSLAGLLPSASDWKY